MSQLQKENRRISDSDVTAMALTTLFAGFDNMTYTTTACVSWIIRTQRYRDRLQRELDHARAAGSLSTIPTPEETQQLPFLQACIAETLHFHASVGIPLPRAVPNGGVRINGHFLRGGVSASVLGDWK